MIRLLALAIAIAISLPAGPGTARAEKRVALVIGNSNYQQAARLPNPANDARDMAALLERIGFDVTLALDQTFQDMRIALRDFADRAAGADIATVYYAGHGIEIDKKNFLIPVDARLRADRDVRFEGIMLDDVLLANEGARGLQITIVDACRENPFATAMQRSGATRSIGRGLARVEPEGSSVLVAFAAREGQVAEDGDGRNSPYTAALLENLETPGMEVGILFRKVREAVIAATGRAQEPFVYQSLGAEPIYLVPPAPAETPQAGEAPVAAPAPKPVATSPLDETAQAWAATKDTESLAVIEAFIQRFAGTVYADLARARLGELQAAKPVEPDRPAPEVQAPPPVQPAPAKPVRTAAVSLPKGSYKTAFGPIDFTCGTDGRCSGNYRGSGDNQPASIVGRLSGDGRLDGHWIETDSAKRCAKPLLGSYYWGKVDFRFGADRQGWKGTWSYCAERPNRNWDGRR